MSRDYTAVVTLLIKQGSDLEERPKGLEIVRELLLCIERSSVITSRLSSSQFEQAQTKSTYDFFLLMPLSITLCILKSDLHLYFWAERSQKDCGIVSQSRCRIGRQPALCRACALHRNSIPSRTEIYPTFCLIKARTLMRSSAACSP